MLKLLVKNVPTDFSDGEKDQFFSLFGATEVICFPKSGKMRNCCYLTFPDITTAKQGLYTIHQFEVLGQKLVAEYAKPSHIDSADQIYCKEVLEKKVFIGTNLEEKKKVQTREIPEEIQNGICSNLNINHDFPDHLVYKYPDPNVMILTNIANALAAVPKFYIQVLHLMNKMNLPPPFATVTLTPPLPGDSVILQDASVDTSDLQEFISSDESEIESDTDHNKKHEIFSSNRMLMGPGKKRKRLKPLAKVEQEKLNIVKTKSSQPVESVFELSSSSKRYEFQLASSIKEAVERKNQPAIHYNVFDERGEFGKIAPLRKDSISPLNDEDDEEEEELDDDRNADYITSTQLKENRISEKEVLTMNQFKNYSPGEKTNRLYIKNLSKQVVEEDLKFIFKRFLRHCSDQEKESLDIRLMQEGRMKGQSFVTLPSEEVAEKALKNVHGYILYEKPMIIQYGRAGKTKQ